MFPKAHGDIRKCVFLVQINNLQPKDIEFTVTEDKRNQKMFTFKKLNQELFKSSYLLKMSLCAIAHRCWVSEI